MMMKMMMTLMMISKKRPYDDDGDVFFDDDEEPYRTIDQYSIVILMLVALIVLDGVAALINQSALIPRIDDQRCRMEEEAQKKHDGTWKSLKEKIKEDNRRKKNRRIIKID